MKKNILKIIVISILFLIFGGVTAFTSLWQTVFEFLKMFFPLFFDAAKMKLEDYITSPYFITGFIMTIASLLGIWFGKIKGKKLYIVVSIVLGLINLLSILMNVFNLYFR